MLDKPFNTGLSIFSVEQLLLQQALSSDAVLVSPIESSEGLQQVLTHLQDRNLGSTAHLFSVADPSQTPTLQNSIAGFIQDLAIEQPSLKFPMSLYFVPLADGNIQPLVDVVARLRDPKGGCPWDLKQTPQTLTKYILEEAYETIEAIQSKDSSAIAEELGDLLLQVVLQAQIARENQEFSMATVCQNITEKLIRRHPHVFGDTAVSSIEEVKQNWEQIKAAEKGQDLQDQNHLSQKMIKEAKTLPPMMGGLKLAKRAADAGLEWPDLAGVWAKFYEELAEFQEALLIGSTDEQLSELGDLLFTLINVARWCDLDPSEALRSTNQKLIQRVQFIESQAEKPLTDHSLEELDTLWNRAKKKLQKAS